MKFTARRTALVVALDAARRAAGKFGSGKPWLGCVRLDATGPAVTIEGFDLDVWVRGELQAEDHGIEAAGAALVDADRLLRFLKLVDEESVTLETDDESLAVSAGSSDLALSMVDEKEWPAQTVPQGPAQWSVDGVVFAYLARTADVAAAREPGRYALHGVRLEPCEWGLRGVSTDGRRLVLVEVRIEEGTVIPALVLPRALDLVGSLLGDGTIEVYIGPNAITFMSDMGLVSTRMVEGVYPDYHGAFGSAGGTTSFGVSVASLDAALERASIACTKDSATVRFTLNGGHLQVEAKNGGVGLSRSDVEVQEVKGKSLPFSLNHRFVREFLRTVPGEAVLRISCDGTKTPVVRMDAQPSGWTYVLSPVVTD